MCFHSHKQGEDFYPAELSRCLGDCQAFCFVLSSLSAKCSIWLTVLLPRGLLVKQALKIIILPSSNFLIWQAHLFGILGYCRDLVFVSFCFH